MLVYSEDVQELHTYIKTMAYVHVQETSGTIPNKLAWKQYKVHVYWYKT